MSTEKTTKAEAAQAANEARRTALRERIQGDSSTGVLKMTDGDNLFHAHLPEGVTVDAVKAVDKARQDYIHDVAEVAKEKALDLYKENKDLAQVNGEFIVNNSREKLQTMFNRESGMSIALVTPITNTKAGSLKEVAASFMSGLDEIFKD